jgi:photosystem II stability/assembly factor-like uncharacterized protein
MTTGPLSPEEARRLLHDAVEAVEPTPDAVRRIHDGYRRRRNVRRVQGAAAGVAVIACAVAAVVFLPLLGQPGRPGQHAPRPAGLPPSAAALAAAIRAGQRAEHDDSATAPVGQFGVLGPEAAWVLDGNGLFTTADAGARWVKITPPVSDPLANILCVTFSGPQHAWAIVLHPESAPSIVSLDRTTDGGHSWSAVSLPAAVSSLSAGSVSFANSADGFAAFSEYQQPHALVFATTDGGAHWHQVTAGAPAVGAGIEFTSASDGWGITDSGRLYGTTDGGLRWTEARLPGLGQWTSEAEPTVSLPVFFGQDGVLLVRGPGGGLAAGQAQIDTTDNDGLSWQPHSLPFSANAELYQSAAQMPFAVLGPDAWRYFGSSEFGGKTYARVTFLRATTDGGRTWTTILPDLGVTGIQSLAFATESDGWALLRACSGSDCEGSGELLLFTSDGGRDFVQVRPPG